MALLAFKGNVGLPGQRREQFVIARENSHSPCHHRAWLFQGCGGGNTLTAALLQDAIELACVLFDSGDRDARDGE
jgi:hypothetical protein